MPIHPLPPTHLGQRIAVIGTTGSGKTTLARRLAGHFHYTHIEIDALHWGPHWTENPVDLFREQIARALSGNGWIVDGNYRTVRELIWSRIDTVIWLDYSLLVIFPRLFRRTFRRVITQEELWSGNQESLSTAVFSRDAILWWALKTYRRRRREYTALIARTEYAGLIVVHLSSPRQTRQWWAEMLQ